MKIARSNPKPLSAEVLAALARLDTLAASLGTTPHTLALYAERGGTYSIPRVIRGHYPNGLLPSVGSDEWRAIADRVNAIADECPLNIRYALMRRSELAKVAA